MAGVSTECGSGDFPRRAAPPPAPADGRRTGAAGRTQLVSNVAASMEETTTGVIRLRAMEKDGVLKLPVLAVLLVATGCGATDSEPRAPTAVAAPVPAEVAPTAPAPPPRASQTVVQATAGTTALDAGQVREIVLEGSAGTGYAWQLEADGSPQLRPVPVPPSPEAAESDGPRLVGGPTTGEIAAGRVRGRAAFSQILTDGAGTCRSRACAFP